MCACVCTCVFGPAPFGFPTGVATRRSAFDVLNFLASKHRQPPEYRPQEEEEEEGHLRMGRWGYSAASVSLLGLNIFNVLFFLCVF